MRRLLPALTTTTLLVGCSTTPPAANAVWQVADVYTTTEYPSTVPDSLAGIIALSVGYGSFNGNTGCSQIIGDAAFTTADGKATTIDNASTMTPTNVEVKPIEEGSCIGRDRFLHDGVVTILGSSQLAVERRGDAEIILRVVGDAAPGVDQPALRLVRSVGSTS